MIMAGVIVLAVLVMIRFRIVSDINEQLVSIGVLEAIGYTSGEIALSYIFEYVLIAACGVIISIVPSVLMTGFLMKNAASTIHYGGEISTAVLPIVLVAVGILIFVALIAMTKARSVRKYPPVLAFRKGIQAHHFKKTYLPLEKTRGNVHVRLAMKGFLQNVRQSFGLTVCIIAATIMVVISFMIGSFFSNADKIVNGVCGHELSDIRIETAGGVDHESFREELQGLEGVKKVLMVGGDIAVTYPDENEQTSLEVYKDYSETESLSVTDGRFPIHDNEVVVTLQVKKRFGLSEGDTVRIEYSKVVRDYIVTGFVNSAIESNTSYMTEAGFKRINPSYTSNTFDIYLKEGVYCQLTGPCYETPAEIRMIKALGASAVGMSTVVEAIAANHMGVKVCGISCISNLAAGFSPVPLSHKEVQEAADKVAPQFKALVKAVVSRF